MVLANKASAYIADYKRYDQYVDLVSIFESLFSNAKGWADTVTHFERYPKVRAPDGEYATPDFTVVFADGTGLAAEIASVAPQDGALTSTCRQLGRYDTLTELPIDSNGNRQAVSHVDVLFLTPRDHDVRVAKRILACIADEQHTYKPSASPLIASFDLSASKSPSRYIIAKLLLAENGVLREGQRSPAIGQKFEEGHLISSADVFGAKKVERVFMNDPIDALYLATHLWTRLFAELSPTHTNGLNPLYLTSTKIVRELRDRYDRGSKADVDRAMKHLQQARLCDLEPDGQTWLIAWHQLQNASGEHDTATRIAQRIAKPPAKGAVRRIRDELAKRDALTLF